VAKEDGVQYLMADYKILIAGGGTGGHLFPALAIGDEIHRRKPNAKIHYVGSNFGLEAKVYPVKDVWHTLLPIRGIQRGFTLKSITRNMILPIRVVKSFYKMKHLLTDFLPDIIIGTGGYASALPLYLAAQNKLSKSIPIILQEQNSFPGLTTRWFSKNAKTICIAFNDANQYLNEKTILTGNPVRHGITNGNINDALEEFDLEKNCKTIFLFGGSQGSAYLNNLMNNIAHNIAGAGIQILWQTGDKEYIKYSHKNSKNIRVIPFINNMANAYKLSDLIICRSGALTIAEITVCGKPSILVPFPSAAGNHQSKNAQALVNAGAARILIEKSLNHKDFYHSIMNLIHDNNELEKMSIASKALGLPNATHDIVNHIFEATN